MKRLGKQKPRYTFFLNPYLDARFTTCPRCGGKTRQRKLPIVIHLAEPIQLISLNKTCRFCPGCELLIAHENEFTAFFEAFFGDSRPPLAPGDYLIVGTMDRADWSSRPGSLEEMLAALHDFKRVVSFKSEPPWVLRAE